MIKKISAMILALIAVICFSGCDIFSIEPESILTVPHPVGDRQEIENLIKQCADGPYELVYPLSGEHKSSILFDESSDSAAALYKTDDGLLHILFAKAKGHSYTLIGDRSIDADTIDRVDFVDTDGDSTQEFLVGYSVGSSKLCSLTLFSVGDTIDAYEVPAVYNALITGDFDADGGDDIIVMLLYSGESIASARLLCTDETGAFSEVSSCELDTGVVSILNTARTTLTDGTLAAAVDGIDGENHYTTQLLYYDTGRCEMMNPLFLYTGYSATRRDDSILSTDIDSDGVVEFPSLSLMDYSSFEDETAVCRTIAWNTYDPSAMSVTAKRTDILCPDGAYLFTLSDTHKDMVTARYDSTERVMTVYAIDFYNGELVADDKLLTIHEYPKSDYDASTIIEAVAGQTGTAVFTYIIEDADHELAFTDDEVTRSFSPISDM